MKNQNFTTSFTVDQTPEEAFAAINNVRGWWSGEIEGSTDKLGEEFTYRFEGPSSRFMAGRCQDDFGPGPARGARPRRQTAVPAVIDGDQDGSLR